jgi:hypothetical protein
MASATVSKLIANALNACKTIPAAVTNGTQVPIGWVVRGSTAPPADCHMVRMPRVS